MAEVVEQTGCTICPAQHVLYPLPPCRADLPGCTMVGTLPLFAVVLVVTQLWGTSVAVLSISSYIKLYRFCSRSSTCCLLRLTDAESSLHCFALNFFFLGELKNCLILQVDGTNLQGFTNQQAVDVLRHTGQTVRLTLIRRCLKQENRIPSQEDFSAPVEKDLLFQTMDSTIAKGN